ncbi:sulfotransferase-like domain-containing protein [Oceanomicrobium pacificus]|uniref:HAD family hydrolase n=1 Tax=Oceanomicrobium pacificus TaxID=2692916 RepID=A0A6B0THM3_9RHOB|nr:HAD family hydrolase [Oceanomicrobium pacificus]
MWSGPRNLSTAMMRSFEARGDCTVRDEPFYAAYLRKTGLTHPMRAEILAADPRDYPTVARDCAQEEVATPLLFQKHMTQHMLDDSDLGWTDGLTHFFLIRAPERVIASYAAKREAPRAEDIGFAQQARLFDQLSVRQGRPPIVIDSAAIRAAPERMLKALCAALGIEGRASMLGWAPGRRPDDGVWAAHWYGAVEGSTGFAGPEGDLPELDGDLARLADGARPHYAHLAAHALVG